MKNIAHFVLIASITCVGFMSGCAEQGQREDVPPLLGSSDGMPPANTASGDGNIALASFSNRGPKDEKAPDTYRVEFQTSAGAFVVEVHRDWSPNGADRFYSLVKNKFYDDCAFFRAMEGFMVQFGIGATPDKNFGWEDIQDDPRPVKSNQPGFITFAKTSMPNSRSTQVFINYGNNARLDTDGFTPFGKVIGGMSAVNSINKEYGGAPSSLQGEMKQRGNAVLKERFPNLDYIRTARIVEGVEHAGGTQ